MAMKTEHFSLVKFILVELIFLKKILHTCIVQAKMLLIIQAPTFKYPPTAIAVIIRRLSKLALLYK
jgi:hypothetical protein